MDNNWIKNEFDLVSLGDERLNKRLKQIVQRVSESPESTINHACNDWAETKAAYRFFSNDTIDYKKILEGHIQSTKARCLKNSAVLVIQDTTYFNYTSHPKTKGLCALSRNRGKHKEKVETLGLLMHSSLAISTDGEPLGLLDQKIYSRPLISEEKKKIKLSSHNTSLPIEEKESFRWLELLRSNHKLNFPSTSKIITICDREADIYELFKLSNDIEMPVLVRAGQNRKVNKTSTHSEKTGEQLWTFIHKQPVIGRIQIKVPEKDNTPERIATLSIRFNNFMMNPPKSKTAGDSSFKLYAIHLVEEHSPKNIEPIEWLLLTNLTVENFEDALEKIKWYCLRWRIEIFHKVLKSGIKVEDCRLSTSARLIRYLAISSVIAWRILWLTLIARTKPDMNCNIFLSETEWKILFIKNFKKSKIPNITPNIKECVIWIAKLGGFLARKNDENPGTTHIWRGLKKFCDILEGGALAKVMGNIKVSRQRSYFWLYVSRPQT